MWSQLSRSFKWFFYLGMFVFKKSVLCQPGLAECHSPICVCYIFYKDALALFLLGHEKSSSLYTHTHTHTEGKNY